MGHKTLSVTADYAHGSPEAMRRAVERCENRQHGGRILGRGLS